MNFKVLIFTSLAVTSQMVSAADVNWTNWSNAGTGTLATPGGSVNVSLTGPALDLQSGDFYYNNSDTSFTAQTGTYGGLMPSDLIRVSDPGTFTLNFSSAVVNPFISLVSVGQPSYPVTYSFPNSFSVISSGANYWGYNGYTASGTDFTGTEFNGILQLHGTYTSLAFTVHQPEFWHGFNIGASAVSAVPEAEQWAMMLLGLPLVSWVARRKQAFAAAV